MNKLIRLCATQPLPTSADGMNYYKLSQGEDWVLIYASSEKAARNEMANADDTPKGKIAHAVWKACCLDPQITSCEIVSSDEAAGLLSQSPTSDVKHL